MSQQIENQIVKMQFDNASFEKNVQTSMSTLDKLKQALKFDKVNMDPLQQSLDGINVDKVSNACDAVTKKFSLLGTIGDQIIRDLTSKFTNAAEKMVKSFTVDQVASGWEKYADKTTAVQTIMANTIGEVGEGLKWKDQAEQMAAITEEIEKLNWFTDETSYSLTDMTNNIGKFVAQKVPLEQASRAMMGISAWAAVSGQTKTQAQMAMYNLSQSLGAGSVKAIDWKSIENANMATAEFKETVIETAKALGVLDKETGEINKAFITAAKYSGPSEVSIENFRDTLSSGWFNSDVLMQSLEKYGGFSEKINELYNAVNREGMVSTTSNLLKVLDDVRNGADGAEEKIRKLADAAEMEVEDLQYFFKELAGDEYDLGRRAFAAAQEAKTFQEAIDATSDAVASEWMGIFEAIFGNYLEAKELWTDLANSLWDIFAGPLDNIKWALMEWKDTEVLVFDESERNFKRMTGREALLDAITTALSNLGDAIEVIRSALAEVFPIFNLFVTEGEDAFDTSEGAAGILEFTKRLHEFAKSLKLSEESASALHTIVVLLASGVKTAFTIIGTGLKGLMMLVGPMFNILDAIFGLIGKIITAITGNDTVNEFNDQLAEGGDKIRTRYLAVMQKVADFLNKVADAIRGIPESKTLKKMGQMFRDAKAGVEEFWQSFVNMPVIQQMIADFNATVEKIRDTFKPVGESVSKTMDDLKRKASKFFSWKTLNDAITKIYNGVKKLVTVIKDFGTRIKTFFDNVKSGKSIVDSFKESFGDIVDKAKELKDNVFKFFSDLFAKSDELGDKFNLKEVQQAIHDFVANITPEQITMIAVASAFMLIAINMLRLSDALRGAVEAFTGIGVALKNVINSYIKKQKSTILQVAEAIVIVAAALWVLSTIPEAELKNAIGAIITLTVCLTALVAVLVAAGVVMQNFGGGQSLAKMASGLAIVAGSLLVAVLAIKALEYVDIEGVLPKLGVLALVMLGLSGIAFIMSKLDKFSKGSLTIIALSTALFIAASALEKIGNIPSRNIKKSMDAMFKMMLGLAALTFASQHVGVFSAVGIIAIVLTLDKILPMIEKIVNYDYTSIQNGLKKNQEIVQKLGLMVGAMVAIGAIAGNRLKGAGIAMLSIAGVFAALIGVAKLASMLKPHELAQGESFIIKMAGVIAALELLSAKSTLGMWGGKNGGEGSKAFIKIAIAMGILLGIAKLASKMSAFDLAKGEAAVVGLVMIIRLMVWAAAKAAPVKGAISAVAVMLFAISMILAEVALLSLIPMEHILPTLGVVLSIMAVMALLANAMSKMLSSSLGGAFGHFLSALPFLAALAGVLMIGMFIQKLSALPIKNVTAAAGSIVGVIVAMAVLAKALSKISGNDISNNQIAVVFESMIMIAAIAAVLGALSAAMGQFNIDPKNMVAAAAAISIVMIGITPALAVLGKMNGQSGHFKQMQTAIIGACALLAVAAIAVGGLSRFGDSNSMITSAIALSIALVAVCVPLSVLAAMAKFLSGTGGITKMGAVVNNAIAVLVLVSASLIAVSRFGDSSNLIQSATALAIGLVAICVPIAVLAAVGQFCKTANVATMWASMGAAVVALLGVAAILVGFSRLMDINAIQLLNEAMPTLLACMIGISIMTVAIAAAGMIPGAQAGFVVMIEAIAAFGVLLVAISALGLALEKINGLKSTLETGLDFLIVVAHKLGEAVGALIDGFGVGATAHLDIISERLVNFSEQMVIFASNMKGVSADAVAGCKNLAEAMLYLTAAEFLDGISRFLNLFKFGKRDFGFGVLGTAIAEFCDAIKDIPEDSITKASACSVIAKRLAEISGSLELEGGLVGALFGEKDLGGFSENIAKFGVGIKMFCLSVKGLPKDAIELAQNAADAAVPMINLTKDLVASGGLLQKLMGEKDLGAFGIKMAAFGGALIAFVAQLKALEQQEENYPELIQKCADATTPMVDLANGIENMGGKLADILGDNTLDAFGDTLVPFVEQLMSFVVHLSDLSRAVPNYKRLIKECADTTEYMVELSNGLENMGGVASVFKGDNTLDRFGKILTDFGDCLLDFGISMAQVDFTAIDGSRSHIVNLIGLGSLASGVAADAFSGLKLALESIAQLPVSSIAGEIDVGTPLLIENVRTMFAGMVGVIDERIETDRQSYIYYGGELVWAVAQGITKNLSKVYQALAGMVSGMKNYLNTSMSSKVFENYGKNVVIGLVKGIGDNEEDAIAAASSMAKKVKAAVPEELEEESPSKASYRYGKFWDFGLANGIRDYASVAVTATQGMSEQVVNSANNIISEISKVIDADMDTQPTIRPVLDTSDIASKAGTIGRMFDSNDLNLAYGISSTMKNNSSGDSKLYSEDSSEPGASNQINFVQNNYSPKALNRIDIYRQTKNQVSMVKGVVANA